MPRQALIFTACGVTLGRSVLNPSKPGQVRNSCLLLLVELGSGLAPQLRKLASALLSLIYDVNTSSWPNTN